MVFVIYVGRVLQIPFLVVEEQRDNAQGVSCGRVWVPAKPMLEAQSMQVG